MAGSKRHVFTSESVTEGHPDKVADQISDAVLDAILSRDPAGRVACETLVTTGMAVVAGEITTSTYVHIPDLVRAHGGGHRLHRRELRVRRPHLRGAHLDRPPVARHRDGRGFGPEQGAGRRRPGHDVRLRHQRDPGADAAADHAGAPDRRAAGRGAEGTSRPPRLEWLRPDGKSQVSVEYEGDRPVAVRTVVVSTQHAERRGSRQLGQGTIREGVIEEVIKPVLDAHGLEYRGTKFLINPTGRFVIGGPHGDAGLTGRKIIVDTYGGMARHGGGAFSGKDPSKVDRSAAYAARWVAKNIVEAKLARRCEVQVAYAIGVARPVSVLVQTFGTGALPDAEIEKIVTEVFDLTPRGIIDALKLKRPIYGPTATYGHFGRRPFSGVYQDDGRSQKVDFFTWERTDRVKDLLSAAR